MKKITFWTLFFCLDTKGMHSLPKDFAKEMGQYIQDDAPCNYKKSTRNNVYLGLIQSVYNNIENSDIQKIELDLKSIGKEVHRPKELEMVLSKYKAIKHPLFKARQEIKNDEDPTPCFGNEIDLNVCTPSKSPLKYEQGDDPQ